MQVHNHRILWDYYIDENIIKDERCVDIESALIKLLYASQKETVDYKRRLFQVKFSKLHYSTL